MYFSAAVVEQTQILFGWNKTHLSPRHPSQVLLIITLHRPNKPRGGKGGENTQSLKRYIKSLLMLSNKCPFRSSIQFGNARWTCWGPRIDISVAFIQPRGPIMQPFSFSTLGLQFNFHRRKNGNQAKRLVYINGSPNEVWLFPISRAGYLIILKATKQ